MTAHAEVMELVARLKAAEETFVLATVVRTVSVTAAKAGAKAIIRPDGTIVAGWIGGGCARGAVLKAAREALADGEPRMVSVQPENLLAELGVKPGENRDGVRFAQKHVPEQGHHGHLRRTGAAASLAGHSRRQPGRAVAGGAGAAARLPRHPCRARRRPDDRARCGCADRRLCARQAARGAAFHRGVDAGQGRRSRVAHGGRHRCRLSRLRRQPPQDGSAARKTDRRRHRRHPRSTASRRRPVSISAPSRRKKSRCRFWPRSPPCGGADSAPQ